MFIKTNRLIIRDLERGDEQRLLDVKNDKYVIEYNPTFIKRNAALNDIITFIDYCQDVKGTGDFSHNISYAIVFGNSNTIIGVITVSPLPYLRETQIGWMMLSEFTGKGYASEAGSAVSDYILDTYNYEYLAVTMDTDNPASFRSAQKSGFRLFEKRVAYDYYYSSCNAEDFKEVNDYFEKNQSQVGSNYYYFRKYNKDSKTTAKFYGDLTYGGRFS